MEQIRELLGAPEVDGLLAAGATLRRRGLVVLRDHGATAASSPVRLAPGLAERLAGVAGDPALFCPAATMARRPVDGTPWVVRHPPSARSAELVKQHVTTIEGGAVVLLDGCRPEEAVGFAVAVLRWGREAILIVDGAAVALDPHPGELLGALRREADLEGAALLVHGSDLVAGAMGPLLVPPHGEAPLLVLLAGSPRAAEPGVLPFAIRRLRLPLFAEAPPPAAGAPATTGAASAAATPSTSKEPDAFQSIREQAARDADRALGIVRPIPVSPPPNRPAAVAVAAPPPPSPPLPAAPAERPPPPPAATPPPPPVAATPEAPPKPRPKRSRKAIEMFGPDPDDEPEVRPAPPLPAVVAPPPVAEAAAEVAGPEPEPLPLANESPDEIARVATISPSPKQRMELLRRLIGVRSGPAVAALRANAKSEHPGVRATAEGVMAQLFGDKWNQSKGIPKPVQPPRSDDPDRGPPGGW